MTQIQINLRDDIIPEKGLGGITLGMNIFFLKECFTDCFTDWDGAIGWKETKKIKFEFKNPFIDSYTIVYRQAIDIYVNPFLGKVLGLKATKGYKGKLWGKISLGDRIKKVEEYADQHNFQFDINNTTLTDGSLGCISNGIFIQFEIASSGDFIESEEHWKGLMRRRIKSITLFQDNLSNSH